MAERPTTQAEAPATAEEIFSAARALGDILAKSPQYIAFLDTLQVVNHDPQVQQIGAKIRSIHSRTQYLHQSAEQTGELAQLENELESLPIVQTYRNTENELRQLMLEVDQMLSKTIGVQFAANAKRSCCG